FIGWHLESGSQMSSKMIPKAYAEEKLGHFCIQNGQLIVVEYSDLPMERQRETDASGKLRFVAGSIAIHILDRDFVRKMASGAQSLPFHRADKKIPTIDAAGNAVKPAQPNGVKFELFVFDALPFAQNPLVIETSRPNEFAPVKNAEGLDSPQTVKEDQLRQYARWANAHGANLSVDETGLPAVTFEVSPLFGYDEASFADSWNALAPKPVFENGTYLTHRKRRGKAKIV
ncbi:MAG TPA: UTP--glucose-1-phosphate uridylyltransferase, partial [Abditibacterium sp.]